MIRKLLKILLALVVALIVLFGGGLTLFYLTTMPEQPDSASNSARWLQAGPYQVGFEERQFVDTSRPTQANGEFAGHDSRTLETSIWYPRNAEGSLPLIIHSHGFISNRTEMSYLAEHLASYGYVVAAADFPLTNGNTPGGPLADDVVNQPGDVSYLIDSLLALRGDDKPFAGTLDTERIAAMGLSLGGLTTTLASFHPEMRDERIKVAVSIAGPAAFFTERFFTHANTPFLMVAGTADAIVPYQSNAAPVPQRVSGGGLLSIDGGSHIGFVTGAEPALRYAYNPDSLGCDMIMANLDEGQDDSIATVLGDATIGVEYDPDMQGICEAEIQEAIHPGRQHMITRLAVLAFMQSHLAQDSADRQFGAVLLGTDLANDFTEARFAPGR
ncbi:MAG: alpha/beta hydrolase family protein [Pseudohongiellaceae bacterium]